MTATANPHVNGTTADPADPAVAAILQRIDETPQPVIKKAAIAFSGGLDSSLGAKLLSVVYHADEIIPITVDIGQGEEELQMAFGQAKLLGLTPVLIDAKEEFATAWLTLAIQANSDYLGYPVSTCMTRQLIAKLVAQKAVELGCDAILEGSSGKGNDQYRMYNAFSIFAPALTVLQPVRDFDLTRGDEQLLCTHYDIPLYEKLVGGDDKTLWCRSLASGAITLETVLPDDVWQWLVPPAKAADAPVTVTLDFANGLPVALNGERFPLDTLIETLNPIAGAAGIGYIDIWEDGIMDLKSRELYEAPAAQVILKAHKDLEGMTLTKDERQFKEGVDQRWAYIVYHGEWFHPLKGGLDAFITHTQARVNGTIELELYKGNLRITNRVSADSLYHPEIRTLQSKSFDQRLCGPAAVIRSLPYKILAQHGLGGTPASGGVAVGPEPMSLRPSQNEVLVQD